MKSFILSELKALLWLIAFVGFPALVLYIVVCMFIIAGAPA